MRLGSKNIEMGECLKSWQRIYKMVDGKTIRRLKALTERLTPNEEEGLLDDEYLEEGSSSSSPLSAAITTQMEDVGSLML